MDDVLVRNTVLIVTVRRESLLKLFSKVGELSSSCISLHIFYIVDLFVYVISVLLHAEDLFFLLNGREHISHICLHALLKSILK